MKKLCIIVLAIIAMFLVGCNDIYEFSGLAFKEVFESLNEGKDEEGNLYYKVSIEADNVFIVVDEDYILDMLDKNKSFYLFMGNPSDYYSRIVINPLLESIRNNKINKIYFVNSNKLKEDSKLIKKLDKDISRSGLFEFKKGSITNFSLGLEVDKELNTDLTKEERDKLIDNYNKVLQK